MLTVQFRSLVRLKRLQLARWRRAVAATCMLLLCGAALNARTAEPTAEAAESSVESMGEQMLTAVSPSQLPGPPPAAPHSWAHRAGDRRLESPDLDVPDQPPERI